MSTAQVTLNLGPSLHVYFSDQIKNQLLCLQLKHDFCSISHVKFVPLFQHIAATVEVMLQNYMYILNSKWYIILFCNRLIFRCHMEGNHKEVRLHLETCKFEAVKVHTVFFFMTYM